MTTNDMLRVYVDFETFTAEDIGEALDMPLGTVQSQLFYAERGGTLVRVRVGHAFLYALSERGLRRAKKLPPVDIEERCLLLVRLTSTDRMICYKGSPVIDTSEDEMSIVGSHCGKCGEFYTDDIPGDCCHYCQQPFAW